MDPKNEMAQWKKYRQKYRQIKKCPANATACHCASMLTGMTADACECFKPNGTTQWTDRTDIGATADWNVTCMRCAKCGTPWLRAFIEHEAFSRSGRFYRAPVTDAELSGITADAALARIEAAPLRIAGGSRFDGVERVSSGPGQLMTAP